MRRGTVSVFDDPRGLGTITADGPLPDVVLNLMEWADAHDRTTDLIQAVQRARPDVPEIQAIAEVLLAADGLSNE